MQTQPANRQTNAYWLILFLPLLLGFVGLVLFFNNRQTPVPASWGAAGGPRNSLADLLNTLQQGLLSPVVASVFGVLILRRQHRHRIGWLLIAIGAIFALSVVLTEWAVFGHPQFGQAYRGAQLAGWTTNWLWIVILSVVYLMIALFPSGSFLSRRWRAVYTLSALLFLIPGLIAAGIETPMTSAFRLPNPFISPQVATDSLYNILFPMALVGMFFATVVVLAETATRYRRGFGVEHEQIKWLLAGVVLFAVLEIVGVTLAADAIFAWESQTGTASVRSALGSFMVNAAVLALFTGIGIAMVRHQLYDIDFLIRRTTSYAILTGLLALIYLASVIVLQRLVTPLTGTSTITVVLSTLLIAALFLPIRRRVQDTIDRRFFRRKYDAQKTLERFAATVRDETDLDALTAELVRVIQETMEPEHVSVWLRPAEFPRPPGEG